MSISKSFTVFPDKTLKENRGESWLIFVSLPTGLCLKMEIDFGPEAQSRGRSRDEKNGCLALIELQVMGQVTVGKCSISPCSPPAALP